eukprot:Clim_evm78s152 gene=Clim_evmTU78s152
MSSLFRSEEMCLTQMFIQSEAAYETVYELGELGYVQFRDLNETVNSFERNFVNEVRRCEEVNRKLRYLKNQVEKADLSVTGAAIESEASHPHARELDELEVKIQELEQEVQGINNNEETLEKNFLELTELTHILNKTSEFFEEAQAYNFEYAGDEETALGGAPSRRLGFVTGVLERERMVAFERVLWRACRGNVFLRQAEIEDLLPNPSTGEMQQKNVFIIFFQGQALERKVRKICEGFSASLYPCPEKRAERADLRSQVAMRVSDLDSVLARTRDHKNRVLSNIALQLDIWLIKTVKIKSIYHTMNMFNFDYSRKALVAEGWCPVANLQDVQLALRRASEASESGVPSILNRVSTHKKPPTFHRTNRFTTGFQSIVDAYGIATYGEVNPGLYTVITFPFLFAVMFGDMGHGFLMFLAAATVIVKEKELAGYNGGEIWDTMYQGRYIIAMMGLFSMYTGFVYNDIFSKSLNIFGSSWNLETALAATPEASASIQFDPDRDFSGTPYLIGVDPYWQLAQNKITFLNSYKMKSSVILGVIHMSFGVCLSVFNHLHFKKPMYLLLQFLPEVIFLEFIFGYLIFIIFYKWFTDFPIVVDGVTVEAPSLLQTLINMFLNFGTVEPDQALYAGQATIQSALVVIAILAIPVLLLGKPLYIQFQRRKKRSVGGSDLIRRDSGSDEQALLSENDHHEEEEEEEEMSEIWVHQGIHTIEFTLGCLSNTASYLRLWALSLAHAQLSEVLWNMVMKIGLGMSGPIGAIGLVMCFGAWAVLTVAVLLLMEGLSAFLHALRLHWVEFQSKFYDGDGYAFEPFSFREIIKNREEKS